MNTMQDEMQAVIHNLEARPWIQEEMTEGDAVCVHGAVMTCQGLQPGDVEIIRAVMRQQGLSESWNDVVGRTKNEVLDRLRSIEVTDEAMAATFGPQWHEIVALIRREATLPEGSNQMRRERGAALRYDAISAAWRSANLAERSDMWFSSREATHCLAQDTALALVIRDLIEQYDFTQEHYDTLTRQWRETIGPIHPDDEHISGGGLE